MNLSDYQFIYFVIALTCTNNNNRILLKSDNNFYNDMHLNIRNPRVALQSHDQSPIFKSKTLSSIWPVE